MLSVYQCLYNPGVCSVQVPRRHISSKLWKEGKHYRRSIGREWRNKEIAGFISGPLIKLRQSSALPKSQLTAFHRRTRFPFQPLPSQDCCVSMNDVQLKHIWLLSGEGKRTVVCLNVFIIEMSLENPYCQGFLPYGLAAAAKDWRYLACSRLVRRVTFHECARISGMNSCTCTFTFWLLCMLFMRSPLWTLLFMSNSDNKIHSFTYRRKANTKEAGTWPNESSFNLFFFLYIFCIPFSALARQSQSRNYVPLSRFLKEDQPGLKGDLICLRVKVGPGQER